MPDRRRGLGGSRRGLCLGDESSARGPRRTFVLSASGPAPPPSGVRPPTAEWRCDGLSAERAPRALLVLAVALPSTSIVTPGESEACDGPSAGPRNQLL